MDKNDIYNTNKSYWDEMGNDFLGAVTLPNLGAFITDEKHNLFGDVHGKKHTRNRLRQRQVLDI